MNDCVKLPSFSEATMQENIQTQPTPVFDFTATINAALAQAIALATAPLLARIAVLEEKVKYVENHAAAADNTFTLASRVALLEEVVKNVADEERIKEIAQDVVDEAITEHANNYDHDWYDREIENISDKVNEAIDDFDFEDKINDALRSATITISV